MFTEKLQKLFYEIVMLLPVQTQIKII